MSHGKLRRFFRHLRSNTASKSPFREPVVCGWDGRLSAVKPRWVHRRGAPGAPAAAARVRRDRVVCRDLAGEGGLPAAPPAGRRRPLRARVGPELDLPTPPTPPRGQGPARLQPAGASAPPAARAEARGGWGGSAGAAQSPAREPPRCADTDTVRSRRSSWAVDTLIK